MSRIKRERIKESRDKSRLFLLCLIINIQAKKSFSEIAQGKERGFSLITGRVRKRRNKGEKKK